MATRVRRTFLIIGLVIVGAVFGHTVEKVVTPVAAWLLAAIACSGMALIVDLAGDERD